jgi:hypothetical protein
MTFITSHTLLGQSSQEIYALLGHALGLKSIWGTKNNIKTITIMLRNENESQCNNLDLETLILIILNKLRE